MPTAVCKNMHFTYWRNTRGSSIREAACLRCGEPLSATRWRNCPSCSHERAHTPGTLANPDGTLDWCLPVSATHCPAGHLLPVTERRKPRMWFKSARRHARKVLGPRGYAGTRFYLPAGIDMPDDRRLDYWVGLLAPGTDPVKQFTYHGVKPLGWGSTFEAAFEDARAKHPEAFLPEKGVAK